MVRPVADWGATAYLKGLSIIAATARGSVGPTERAIIVGRHIINLDFENDAAMVPWRERARTYGIRSSSALPLRDESAVIGA